MRKILSSPFSLVAVIILFIFLVRATYRIHDKVVLSGTKLDQAEIELSKIRDREVDLTAQVGRLSTEQGVEAEIRTKYKGVRDGESVAVIISEEDNASDTESVPTETTSWFRRLLQKVGI